MLALLIYRIISLILMPLLLLALLFRSINNSQYRQGLWERLGFFPTPDKGGIVIHAASVGEVIALTPLVEQLLRQHPHLPITMTTFTPTGLAQVNKHFGHKVQQAFLPLDVFPCTQLFLTRLQPKMMIFMETELWPNLISQCASKGIKLLLINGRLSTNSMKNYQKINRLITPTLNHFDHILCQSQDNLAYFIKLGACKKRCQVSGNLKYDISLNARVIEKQATLAALFPNKNPVQGNENRSVWLVASTHQGDEEIALQAFAIIKNAFPQLLLVLVPRHPERFDSVAKQCIKQGYSLAKRSQNTQVTNQDIWLLDTLGELMPAYSLANVVTMGGSFSNIGGHNPLEPALYKKAIIVGSDMRNFSDIVIQLIENKAIVQLSPVESDQHHPLAQAVIQLLNDKNSASLLGANAHNVVQSNQGASARTLAQIRALLS